MRPFKMFFGLALVGMFILFIARVAFVAFIIAAVMSIIYAVFRRIKDFITYDRYGEYYIPKYEYSRLPQKQTRGIEPLFNGYNRTYERPVKNVRFIDAL